MRLIRRGQSSAPSLLYGRRYGLFDGVVKILSSSKPEDAKTFSVYEQLKELSKSTGWKAEGGDELKPRVVMPAIQHLLGTTGDLFQFWKENGLETVFLAGKPYSTHTKTSKRIGELGFHIIPSLGQFGYGHYPETSLSTAIDICKTTVDHLASNAGKYSNQPPIIFFLDDGGVGIRAWETHVPKLSLSGAQPIIIGAEQTNGGSNGMSFRGIDFPTILISQSHVKIKFEYPSVAEVIFDKFLASLSPDQIKAYKRQEETVGIVGYGELGRALAKKFHKEGFQVIVHEHEERNRGKNNGIIFINEFGNFIQEVSCVISATGKDITPDKEKLKILVDPRDSDGNGKDLILMSAGSGNKDYESFLRYYQSTKQKGKLLDPLETFIFGTAAGNRLTCVNGLFPANFTPGAEHSVQPAKIFPTRALIAGSLEQALQMVGLGKLPSTPYMLCPWRQWQTVQHVFSINQDHPAIAELLEDERTLKPAKVAVDIIRNGSGGERNVYDTDAYIEHLIERDEQHRQRLKALQAPEPNTDYATTEVTEYSNYSMKF